MSTRNIYWGKGGQCVGLTTLPPSRVDCLEIWEPQPPGTLKVLSRPVMVLLYIYIYCTFNKQIAIIVLFFVECLPEDGRKRPKPPWRLRKVCILLLECIWWPWLTSSRCKNKIMCSDSCSRKRQRLSPCMQNFLFPRMAICGCRAKLNFTQTSLC